MKGKPLQLDPRMLVFIRLPSPGADNFPRLCLSFAEPYTSQHRKALGLTVPNSMHSCRMLRQNSSVAIAVSRLRRARQAALWLHKLGDVARLVLLKGSIARLGKSDLGSSASSSIPPLP
jgi:hypothetical protein